MSNKENMKNVLVIGATIFEHMDKTQKAWIKMIEEEIIKKLGEMISFQEYVARSDALQLSRATKKELQTIFWEKYQEQVKLLEGVFSK